MVAYIPIGAIRCIAILGRYPNFHPLKELLPWFGKPLTFVDANEKGVSIGMDVGAEETPLRGMLKHDNNGQIALGQYH
jgi:hypothetical protein